MRVYAFRLTNGADLKRGIIEFASKNGIKAGCVLACAGSLQKATIRMADSKTIKTFNENHEIVSLTGTLGNGDAHLHISVSDKKGRCIGGHLKDGSIVGLTAEMVIAEFDGYSFAREFDERTGYNELVVKKA